MALINCPGCAGEVSDQANTCPHCGCPVKTYAGRLSDFGFGRLLKAEVNSFWGGGFPSGDQVDRRVDISRGRLFKIWAMGLLGTLGFNYFAAGRFIAGTLRFLYGALIWGIIIGVLFSADPQDAENRWGTIRALAVLLLLPPSVFDIAVMGLGKFRDAFRNFIK